MSDLFDNILSLDEVVEEWQIEESQVLNKILDNDLKQGIDVKRIDNIWVFNRESIKREFGSLEDDDFPILSNMIFASSQYESYVKNAFQCERGMDPAGCADANVFDLARDTESFYLAKASLAYSSLIYNKRLNEDFDDLSEDEIFYLNHWAKKILSAEDKDSLLEYMNEHNNLILSIEEKRDF